MKRCLAARAPGAIPCPAGKLNKRRRTHAKRRNRERHQKDGRRYDRHSGAHSFTRGRKAVVGKRSISGRRPSARRAPLLPGPDGGAPRQGSGPGEEGISCPAAAAAFGFRPLPKGLESGKGLVGFGIVSNEAVGRNMFARMPKLKPGRIQLLHLYPLEQATVFPDVVVVEEEVEKLMWIVLSQLHSMGGQRVPGHTAVLQATCVDSTIVPYEENRLNFGFGCYGCRDATDIGTNETVLGFPAAMLPAIVEHLAFLGEKAIPTSRSKKALRALQRETQAACSA
ncbi:MAG: DUF169 domain-containing protein [Deltaproteobacteria bacterium]|nr:DUF169 domain-containing protein [Deltaproteobacteria bacterium]